MSATRQKLNEAVILLKQAHATSGVSYTVFIANLNAFVSAARSVTLVMQKQLKHVEGFEKWYGE
jgi:hypothetical protein